MNKKHIVLIGYGNVGKNIEAVLVENGHHVDIIVRSDGVYENGVRVADTDNFFKYIKKEAFVFISTPTFESPDASYLYYKESIENDAYIITCEKSVLTHYPDLLKDARISCSATVGGDSGMLPALVQAVQNESVYQAQAVVNGTLNYIAERFLEGATKEEVFREVTEKGFAESGVSNFDEVILSELQDVLFKAVILANASGLYSHIILKEDVQISGYREGMRCVVRLSQNKIEAGFIEENTADWLPKGVNASLLVNGVKITEGPGAGGRITAERMYKDFLLLQRN